MELLNFELRVENLKQDELFIIDRIMTCQWPTSMTDQSLKKEELVWRDAKFFVEKLNPSNFIILEQEWLICVYLFKH